MLPTISGIQRSDIWALVPWLLEESGHLLNYLIRSLLELRLV